MSGKVVVKMSACGDTDDLFYDSLNRMIYMSGGAGCLSIFDHADSNNPSELRPITTPWGARTSLFVPSNRTLYVAVPHRRSQPAEILIFKALPDA
jgi:hypothetical protein